jgi:CheY-specific phosphatase CheX
MTKKEAQVLADAGAIIRQLTAERDAALTKVASSQLKEAAYKRHVHAEKVAMQMHQKGINTDIALPDLVTDLEKAAQEGRLTTIEEAVDMVGPDMSFKTASIHDAPTAGAGEDDLTRFLIGGIG